MRAAPRIPRRSLAIRCLFGLVEERSSSDEDLDPKCIEEHRQAARPGVAVTASAQVVLGAGIGIIGVGSCH